MTRASRNAGGDAAGGGFDFQATLGAIAYVHVLCGTPVNWAADWSASPPAAVEFETRGPGDDIRLVLADGTKIEVQAKRRLSATDGFWSALDDLFQGIVSKQCDYGILAVGPVSSNPVKEEFARALHRLGSNSVDNPSKAQIKLDDHLRARSFDSRLCSAVRIKTVSGLPDTADAIGAARSELAHVCADVREAPAAWAALYRDAMAAISNRERRTLSDLLTVLRASNIEVSKGTHDSPAKLAQSLLEWTKSDTEYFSVLAMPPLPTDQAWLPLRAFVRDAPPEDHSTLDQALAAYHATGDESANNRNQIDAKTIGTFRKQCVIVGGPGSGKSLLLDVIARELAKDSIVSLRVSLRSLATRIEDKGCPVEEGLFDLGFDGSPIQPRQLRSAQLPELALLCDGLDECGDYQATIAACLRKVSESNPSFRLIVTTRPIGYDSNVLRRWRHYEIAALTPNDVPMNLETLCRCALQAESISTDGLTDRIKTHLDISDANRTLARTPLLLALGASLFLRSNRPSWSKSELYAGIFRLIDETPAPRKRTSEAPTRAVRDAVLNRVGWSIVASPLLTSSQTEAECVDWLQRTMGVPSLRARSEVQQAIAYWEQARLIERLHHTDVELIAFVHKTCGEFAAARHLSDLRSEEARTVIREQLGNPDSMEILDFATQTPLATTMAEMLLAEFESRDPDPDILERLFPIIARPETSLSTADRTSFLERVFHLAKSEDRRKAYRAGASLASSDLSGMPQAAAMSRTLLSAPAEWSRLIGWAVLARHFPDGLDLDLLEKAFQHFADRSRDDSFFVFEKRTALGTFRDRAVFEEFLFSASTCLLAQGDTAQQDRTINVIHDLHGQLTGGFVWRFDALLKELGRGELMERHRSRWRSLFEPDVFSPFPEWDERSAYVLQDVVSAAFVRESSSAAPETGMKYLSAFLRMAGVLRAVADDVYVWPSAAGALPDVHVALRAAAVVFGLPAERLAREAKDAVKLIGATASERARHSTLTLFPDVDPPDIDWRRARRLATDLPLLEKLVHHPSVWLSRLATRLLHEQLDSSQRAGACRRILATGTGNSLRWGAMMATALPAQDGSELILRRLEGAPDEGLYRLFALVADQELVIQAAHRTAITNGLFNCGPSTAAAAARWCKSATLPDNAWISPLLQRALDYWLSQEDTVFSRIVHPPGDARESLLHALCTVTTPDPHLLAELLVDSRHNVSHAALKFMTQYAAESAEGRAELIGMIVARRFSASLCNELIDEDIPFAEDDLTAMATHLRGDSDPEFRLVAIRKVLGHPNMDTEVAMTTAQSMTRDGDADVSDAAYLFLDSAQRAA